VKRKFMLDFARRHEITARVEMVINAANRAVYGPCWCCGLWVAHLPGCSALRTDADRYLVKPVKAAA